MLPNFVSNPVVFLPKDPLENCNQLKIWQAATMLIHSEHRVPFPEVKMYYY